MNAVSVCPKCGASVFIDVHTPCSDMPELTTFRWECSVCSWFGDEWHSEVEVEKAEEGIKKLRELAARAKCETKIN